MSKIKRQSGIELLRIIAMIQIIFLHAYQYGFYAHKVGDIDGILVTFVWSFCRTIFRKICNIATSTNYTIICLL